MDHKFEGLLLKYIEADTIALRTEIEAVLWKEFGTRKAIFVMDMSGFSLLTQKYGIVHYLSMVKRMQLTTRPIIEQLGGEIVKFEADNCFAMFDDALAAAHAAVRLNAAFDTLNLFTEDNFDIRISIGIDYGDVLLIGGPDYFGETVNFASKLGEDTAGPGEIYLTRRAFEQIPVEAGYTGELIPVSFSGVQLEVFNLKYTR